VTTVAERLGALGITLPGPFPPHDPLDAVVVHGGRARTSGQLPRDLAVAPAVRELYIETWDALQAEP